MTLPDGLYDLLLTEGLARSLAGFDPSHADVPGEIFICPQFSPA